MDRTMIDAASRGVLMNKTPTIVRNLISNMASNSQQFGTKGVAASRGDNSPSLEELKKQLAASNIEFQQNVKTSNV
ncbi:hypothetical protein CR513_13607, partial [Mucuna pruriens]